LVVIAEFLTVSLYQPNEFISRNFKLIVYQVYIHIVSCHSQKERINILVLQYKRGLGSLLQ